MTTHLRIQVYPEWVTTAHGPKIMSGEIQPIERALCSPGWTGYLTDLAQNVDCRRCRRLLP